MIATDGVAVVFESTHAYPGELVIASRRMSDPTFDVWLEVGHYASSILVNVVIHFNSDVGYVILESSFPNCLVDRPRV